MRRAFQLGCRDRATGCSSHGGPGAVCHSRGKKDLCLQRRRRQGLFPSPFSGGPSRGYSQFYAGLKAAGQYQLVSDPADADLVLELQLTAPNGPTNGSKVNGSSDPVPMFRLVVYDAKTHFVLWALTQSIEVAYLQKTHDHNFDGALDSLLLEFEALSGKALAPPR